MSAVLEKLGGMLLAGGALLALMSLSSGPMGAPPLHADAPKWPDTKRHDDKICPTGYQCNLCPAQKAQTYGCSARLDDEWRSGYCSTYPDSEGKVCLETFFDCGARMNCFTQMPDGTNECIDFTFCKNVNP